jgi:formylglycine-generating enzyme required for sulfatase activity
MKNRKQRTFGSRAFSPWVFAVIAAIIVAGFIFTGCKNGDDEVRTIPVTGVVLSQSKLGLMEGAGGEELTAIVLPENATNKAVTWSTNRPTLVSVTVDAKTGVATVRGLAVGDAVITVTTKDGNKKDICDVKVGNVEVNSVTLDKDKLDMVIGATAILVPTVLPAEAANKAVDWYSSDTDVATVALGIVTAVGSGTAYITVESRNGIRAECEVNVSYAPVTGITLALTTLKLTEGKLYLAINDEEPLKATVLPANADPKVTWVSSSPSVASVDNNGKIKALTVGQTTITVTTVGKNAAGQTVAATPPLSVDVAATVAVTGVTLDKSELSLNINGTETLTATVSPANATNKDVSWSISPAGFATVTGSGTHNVTGTVTAEAEGSATITVTANGNKTATCAVTVTDRPAEIGDLVKMVWIEPGKFMMGSPSDEVGRGTQILETQHEVTLTKGFYMGKYEVTQEQFEEVMWYIDSYPTFRGANYPVEWVNWYEAIAFCNWMSDEEDLWPVYWVYMEDAPDIHLGNNFQNPAYWSCYPDEWGYIPFPGDEEDDDYDRWYNLMWLEGDGYRLPTEAEWEYACRAGTTTRFYYGNNITEDDANYNGDVGRTTVVGSYPPNKWGLYDMHGNVEEWCWDWLSRTLDYPAGAQTDPEGPSTNFYHDKVIRGGSFLHYDTSVRSAGRDFAEPTEYGQTSGQNVLPLIGFRVVRDAPEDTTSSRKLTINGRNTRLQAALQQQKLRVRPQTQRGIRQDIQPRIQQAIPQNILQGIRTFDRNSDSPAKPQALRRKATLE